MQIKVFLLLILFMPTDFAKGQNTDLPGTNAVYLEMYGVSLFSLHYEKAWFSQAKRFHLVTSLGYGFAGASRPDREGEEWVHYLPLRGHVLYRILSSGTIAHHYVYAGPTIVASNYLPGHDGERAFANASEGLNLGVALELGYRFQAANGGLVRIGLTTIPAAVGDVPVDAKFYKTITLSPAISIGYTFLSGESK
jgi:hypothetical protein